MPYINLGGVHAKPSNYSAWLELGGTGLDAALIYGDDVQLHIGDAIASSGIPRKRLFVTSKVPCCPADWTMFSAGWCSWYTSEFEDVDAYTRASIDARLMGVEYVDLMLLHWPCDTMNQTLSAYRALEDYALAGKAKAIGLSNFNASAIDALYAAGLRVPPAVNQCGFSIGNHNSSLLGSDFETLAKCRENNISYAACVVPAAAHAPPCCCTSNTTHRELSDPFVWTRVVQLLAARRPLWRASALEPDRHRRRQGAQQVVGADCLALGQPAGRRGRDLCVQPQVPRVRASGGSQAVVCPCVEEAVP
jgi:diketogulonate reductase-like aldo/keto reductase